MSVFDDPNYIVFRYSGSGDGRPIVPLRITVPRRDELTVLPAVVCPHLLTSCIGSAWAEALELSERQAVVAQIVRGYDEPAEEWGPAEMLTPEFEDAISPDDDFGFMLGQDFLLSVTTHLLGPVRIVVLGPGGEVGPGR